MRHFVRSLCCVVLVATASTSTHAQQAISYQGRLKLSGTPVNGACDVRVSLWSAQTGGVNVHEAIEILNVPVNKGLFTIAPDFGLDVWDGSARFLEIAVRSPAGSGSYTTLSPREQVAPVPYALFAEQGGEWRYQAPHLVYMGGGVGIGTPTPAHALQVSTTDSRTSFGLVNETGTGHHWVLESYGSGSGALAGTFAISDYTANKTRFSITETGLVGIGTMEPESHLEVVDSIADLRLSLRNSGLGGHAYQLISTASGSGYGPGSFRLFDTTSNFDCLVVGPTGKVSMGNVFPDAAATLRLGTANGTSLTVDGAITSAGDLTLQSAGGSLLKLNPAGQWVMIGTPESGGRLGIGRVPGLQALEVAGSIAYTGDLIDISDRRAKEEILALTNALETLRAVNPVSYHFQDWYLTAHPEAGDFTHFGVIADEFAQIFPDSVNPIGVTAPDGTPLLGVDTSPLLPYSVAAILELDTRNRELESTVNAQAEELNALRARLERIERLLEQAALPAPSTPSR